MQNNMYKLCSESANTYAEKSLYAKNVQKNMQKNMQNMQKQNMQNM